jgi:hypothetical protein
LRAPNIFFRLAFQYSWTRRICMPRVCELEKVNGHVSRYTSLLRLQNGLWYLDAQHASNPVSSAHPRPCRRDIRKFVKTSFLTTTLCISLSPRSFSFCFILLK